MANSAANSASPKKVTILGSGNWGTAVAMIVAENAARNSAARGDVSDATANYLRVATPPRPSAFARGENRGEVFQFDETVTMYCFPETIASGPHAGKYLHDVINQEHENVKYLPGFTLPPNLVAESDLEKAVGNADLVLIIAPHQFVERMLINAKPFIKPHVQALSFVKGLHLVQKAGKILPITFSDLVTEVWGVDCCALSGANVAKDVANRQFCESTVGYNEEAGIPRSVGEMWRQLTDTVEWRIQLINDVEGVQICGAVKNLIAVAAGFCDGMGLGSNTKSAIIRLGINEMKSFSALYFEDCLEDTFFESAGFADVITTCFGGRNVRCAAEFARRRLLLAKQIANEECASLWNEVEAELLNGQKMQGHLTAHEVFECLVNISPDAIEMFPLFHVVYRICYEGIPVESLINRFTVGLPDVTTSEENTADVSPPSHIKRTRRVNELRAKLMGTNN